MGKVPELDETVVGNEDLLGLVGLGGIGMVGDDEGRLCKFLGFVGWAPGLSG